MRLLLEAYRVLSDPESRRAYDRGRLRIVRQADTSSFDYHEWLMERLDEPEYIAKLIVYDLLHKREDEAVRLYDSVRGRQDARLERFFERPEAMDAEFCLAEEYVVRARAMDAFEIMSKLILMEQKKPGFGYFYDVVLQRFRRLVLEDIGRNLEASDELALLKRALALHSSADNDAQFFRRQAELYVKGGRMLEAIEAIAKAQALKPRLPGLRALSRRASAWA